MNLCFVYICYFDVFIENNVFVFNYCKVENGLFDDDEI